MRHMTCYHYHQPGHMRQDSHRGKDPRVMGHLSPNHQWDMHRHNLSLPQHRPGEPVSVLRCDIGTGYFVDRLERPSHGSRLGTGLIGRDFGNPWACLCHYTSD